LSKLKKIILFLATITAISLTVSAQEVTVDPTMQFCFSMNDFTNAETDEGIFITSIPSSNIANIQYGARTVKAGDALSIDALNNLTVETSCVTEQTASIEYFTICDGKVSALKALKMSIKPKKNEPPIASDSSIETYKNIANTGILQVTDPDDDALTYAICDQPKRGCVELHDDGSFTYTPKENKVGNDSFTYTVTDAAGNVSEKAKVSVIIKKATEKETYADMAHDPDHFTALWMKEEGIFTGFELSGQLCFQPDAAVERGEFLLMAMKLVNADQKLTTTSSGFSDEEKTPDWMQPYIATALINGMISGANTEEGVVFRPTDVITKAEAAAMLQNILDLPVDSTPVFAPIGSETAGWAEDAVAALTQNGIVFEINDMNEPFTRRDAANTLYQIKQIIERKEFYWQ